MKEIITRERYYEDEPIRFSPEQARRLPPREYRSMRALASGSPFSHDNDAKIFYLQAKYMEHFEDDCPYDREVTHYYPTYQSLSTSELRGYFTWRSRLRRGDLEKTSLSYAYLYIYELLHQIGSKTKEEGLDALLWFYTQYGALDARIQRHTRQWIIDYAIYYDLPAEQIRDLTNADFDEALTALRSCDTVSDETLFAAILRLSSYRPEKSRAYKQIPEEFANILCAAYRRQNDRYARRYGRPYSQKLYGKPFRTWYSPFRAAVFYDRKNFHHYEYHLSPAQRYFCEEKQWNMERDYLSPQRSRDLGVFVRTADRLIREAYDVKPPLKPGNETKTMVQFISEAIAEQKKRTAAKIDFDLSKLSGIRKSSDAVGQKLMTEEERYVETVSDEEIKADENPSPAECILSGDELRFLQILLYGGDLQGFLSEKHRMASVLAEAVNEQLYDEFADTVIEFDGNTPVLVEDYLDDLKGMIPN
ncbi:MAG: TerB N-terminal domain-containing protein [Clostridiales bacterium]|nr:TerB N-terminal domain-containing protein [Clostridiales bacterium]